MVSDMEEHISQRRMKVEEMKQYTDPAAATKYNNVSTFSIV